MDQCGLEGMVIDVGTCWTLDTGCPWTKEKERLMVVEKKETKRRGCNGTFGIYLLCTLFDRSWGLNCGFVVSSKGVLVPTYL